jgi:hypothetical protein
MPHQPMDNLALVFGQVPVILNLVEQINPARPIFKYYRSAYHKAEVQ